MKKTVIVLSILLALAIIIILSNSANNNPENTSIVSFYKKPFVTKQFEHCSFSYPNNSSVNEHDRKNVYTITIKPDKIPNTEITIIYFKDGWDRKSITRSNLDYLAHASIGSSDFSSEYIIDNDGIPYIVFHGSDYLKSKRHSYGEIIMKENYGFSVLCSVDINNSSLSDAHELLNTVLLNTSLN